MKLAVSPMVAGSAEGQLLVLEEPISFWGGVDPLTGEVLDSRHPQHGTNVAGTVLVLPFGRGSSSSTSVLAEMIRVGVAPAALILGEVDPVIALAAVVARELYGKTIPVSIGNVGGLPSALASGRPAALTGGWLSW